MRTLWGTTDLGEKIEIIAFDGHQATIHSPRPFAPGQPIKLVLPLDTPCEVEGRSFGSKLLPIGARFETRLRLVGLKREDRLRWLDSMQLR